MLAPFKINSSGSFVLPSHDVWEKQLLIASNKQQLQVPFQQSSGKSLLNLKKTLKFKKMSCFSTASDRWTVGSWVPIGWLCWMAMPGMQVHLSGLAHCACREPWHICFNTTSDNISVVIKAMYLNYWNWLQYLVTEHIWPLVRHRFVMLRYNAIARFCHLGLLCLIALSLYAQYGLAGHWICEKIMAPSTIPPWRLSGHGQFQHLQLEERNSDIETVNKI